mmetsp:Transcript_82433/g.223364  ORF Transcript_82433/g.223364 Transcript_82433/m.223364 type:complete len:278 (-) Transcript_82433:19-852(-)
MAGGRLLGGAVPRPRPEPPGLRGQVRGTWAPPALAVPCLRDPAGPGALRHLRRLGAQEPSRRLDRGRWHPVDLPRHDAHQIEGGHREDPHGGHAPPVGWRRGRADVRRAVPAHRQRLLRLLVRPLRVCPGGLEALPRRRPEGHARGRRAAGCGGWRVGGVRPPGPALPAGVGARPRGARGISGVPIEEAEFASPAAQALESPSRHARLVAAEGRRQRAAEQGAGGHKNPTWRDATFSATRVCVSLGPFTFALRREVTAASAASAATACLRRHRRPRF